MSLLVRVMVGSDELEWCRGSHLFEALSLRLGWIEVLVHAFFHSTAPSWSSQDVERWGDSCDMCSHSSHSFDKLPKETGIESSHFASFPSRRREVAEIIGAC